MVPVPGTSDTLVPVTNGSSKSTGILGPDERALRMRFSAVVCTGIPQD
jgi:hypothetical protein